MTDKRSTLITDLALALDETSFVNGTLTDVAKIADALLAKGWNVAGEGLDVRRLTTAMHNVMWPGQPHDWNGPDPIWGDNDCACSAGEIAREYAANQPVAENDDAD